MPLRVLDGNQTATTLSSVVTGGEHIVAHTVVSLGSTAISNITGAVSGSVVSISNFPATQTIAGTVTANIGNYYSAVTVAGANAGLPGELSSTVVTVFPVSIVNSKGSGGGNLQGYNGGNSYIHVGIQNIGGTSLNGASNLPISGTVAANGGNFVFSESEDTSSAKGVLIGFEDDASTEYRKVTGAQPLPISISAILS